MKLPRIRLSTLCLFVLIAALSFSIVVRMKRHQDEVTQLRAELAAAKNARWTHWGYTRAWSVSWLETAGGTP
jgi:hypothetical protein